MQDPDPASVRQAVDLAWRDHHHARDQSWKALHLEALVAAAMFTVDAQYHHRLVTLMAGLLTMASGALGFWIALHHRILERRKFLHIMNCDQWLGLHRDDLIPHEKDGFSDPSVGSRYPIPDRLRVKMPSEISPWHVLSLRRHSTATFIMLMHMAVILFAALLVTVRFCIGNK